MDCSIIPSKKYKNMSLISTTDFFFPLIQDPYIQGKIAACNVLSDMYSMGVIDIDNVLMLLAASLDMTENERFIVTKLMMKGFDDAVKEAGSVVSGGQTVHNPWPIIGGVAQSIVQDKDVIMPINGKVGDIILLTKPLGIQLAVNTKQWMGRQNANWEKSLALISVEEANQAYFTAVTSMSTLNKNGAILMHKYGAHAATDITGFGILGHASNLASNQVDPVSFEIHTLPIIKNMDIINNNVVDFGLIEGYAAETSGGLFVLLPDLETAENYIRDLKELCGNDWGWIIGNVISNESTENKNSAHIVNAPKIISV